MRFLFFISVLLAFSCDRQILGPTKSAKAVKMEDIPEDIKIPIKLWDEIEKQSRTNDLLPKAEEAKPEQDDDTTNRGTILFSHVEVKLREHNSGVLESPEIKIQLPRGGGEIDLAKYMGSKTGSFYVQFEYPDWTEATSLRSYYISRARKRMLDGETYGAGCNKYMEITSKMSELNPKEGIKVNTTRDRHTTVLGGHFVFSAKKGTQTFLSQVTFVDSKSPHLLCDITKTL